MITLYRFLMTLQIHYVNMQKDYNYTCYKAFSSSDVIDICKDKLLKLSIKHVKRKKKWELQCKPIILPPNYRSEANIYNPVHILRDAS